MAYGIHKAIYQLNKRHRGVSILNETLTSRNYQIHGCEMTYSYVFYLAMLILYTRAEASILVLRSWTIFGCGQRAQRVLPASDHLCIESCPRRKRLAFNNDEGNLCCARHASVLIEALSVNTNLILGK